MGLVSWLVMKAYGVAGSSEEMLFNITQSMDLAMFNSYLSTYNVSLDAFNPQLFHTLHTSLLGLLIIVLTTAIWCLAFRPLDRVKGVADVGWEFMHPHNNGWLSYLPFFPKRTRLSGRKLAERINRLQKIRKAGKLPPVYPNGWFAVEESRNVKIGQVVPAQVFGQNLAVFRGDSGQVMTVDAYCPHLGANLAAGGVVKGDCIECPFHGWQFDGHTGSCTVIPYTAKVPEVAKVKYWKTREVNGSIFVWFDAEDREPTWEIPEVKEVTSGYWRYRGRTQHEILAHIQEIPENGADIAHLGHLHLPSVFKGADLDEVFTNNKLTDFATHEWSGVWEAMEGKNCHMAKLNVETALAFKVFGLKLFKMAVEAHQIGPGLVHLHFDTNLGKGVLVQMVTPIGPLRQKVVHHLYTAPTFVAPYAKFVLLAEARHFERDITIWNSKQYINRPLLVAEDKLIKRFRTWYQQFYSENSPTMDSVGQYDTDW